jgi:hypothetical protein
MEEFNQHCLDILEYYYSERTWKFQKEWILILL